MQSKKWTLAAVLASSALLMMTGANAKAVEAQTDARSQTSDKAYEASMDAVEALQNEGLQLFSRERYEDAIAPLEKALAICEKDLGQGPYMALVLQNLGIIYASSGHLDKAEAAYKRALTTEERIYEPDDKHFINTYVNLGLLYSNTGRFAEAEPFMLKAVEICEKVSGPNDSETEYALDNLAKLYVKMGRQADADLILKKIEAIHRANGKS